MSACKALVSISDNLRNVERPVGQSAGRPAEQSIEPSELVPTETTPQEQQPIQPTEQVARPQTTTEIRKGATIELENGKVAEIVDIAQDGTVSLMGADGEIEYRDIRQLQQMMTERVTPEGTVPEEPATPISDVVQPTPQVPEPLPMKEGMVDYDTLVQTDPARFVQEYDREFGQGSGAEAINEIAQKAREDLDKLQKKLQKANSLNDKAQVRREIAQVEQRLQSYESLLAPKEEVPTDVAPERVAEPTEQPTESVEQPTQRPTEEVVERPVESVVEQPAEEVRPIEVATTEQAQPIDTQVAENLPKENLEKVDSDTTFATDDKGVSESNNILNITQDEYTDEFRRVQEESKRLSNEEISQYHRGRENGGKQLSDSDRRLLGETYGRLLSRGDRLWNGQWVTLIFPKYGNQFHLIQVNGSLFHDIFEINRKYLKNGELVDLHEDYSNAKCYLTEDGLGGFAIEPDGNVVSLFSLNPSDRRGFVYALKDFIREQGGTHLDAYNSKKQPLLKIYEKTLGAKVASFMDYSMEYDHDNIATNHSNPDIVFMVLTDGEVTPKRFKGNQYDEAVNYQKQHYLQPIGKGEFGDIYDQFRGDAQGAIEFLLQKKSGEALGALSHKDVGEIDLVWGKEGSGKSDGYGLAKLAKYHPEVLDNLQSILDDMSVVSSTPQRVQLESNRYQAAVRLTWNEENKRWLLTAFEKKNSVSNNTTDTVRTLKGSGNDTATSTNAVSSDKDNTQSSKNQISSKKDTKAVDRVSSPILKVAQKERSGEELVKAVSTKVKNRFSLHNYTSKTEGTNENGVYHNPRTKRAEATDGTIYLSSSADYNKKYAGKIVVPRSKGKEFKGFTSWAMVNDAREVAGLVSVDLASLAKGLDQAGRVSRELTQLGSTTQAESYIILGKDKFGKDITFDASHLSKFVYAAVRFGITPEEISYVIADGDKFLLAQNGKAKIALKSIPEETRDSRAVIFDAENGRLQLSNELIGEAVALKDRAFAEGRYDIGETLQDTMLGQLGEQPRFMREGLFGERTELTQPEETAITEAITDRLKEGGIQVITDKAEGQRVLDAYYALEQMDGSLREARLSRERRREYVEKVNNEFNEKLNNLNEDNANSIILSLGDPNDKLLSAGVENKPLRLYGNKLLKKSKSHNFDINDVRDLPKYIENPIAIFEGSTNNSHTILTELRLRQGNVLVTLSLGKNNDVDFNVVSSIYDKHSKGVVNWINSGKLLYVNHKKALDYLRIPAPIAGALNNQEHFSATNIIKNFENPKLPSQIRVQITDKVKLFKNSDGTNILGFTKDGKIYLDPTQLRADTPIHEYSHIWAEVMRKSNPTEWKNIENIFKTECKEIWERVKKDYPELKTDSQITDEVLAHYSGSRGRERIAEEMRNLREDKSLSGSVKMRTLRALAKVQEVLNRFWRWVGENLLHIHFKSAEEVADRVLYDLVNKTDLKSAVKRVNENSTAYKRAQFEKIHKANPMLDGYHTGLRNADEIKTFEEALKADEYEYEKEDYAPDYTAADVRRARKSGKITIYSSYPINEGVFVTPSKMEAQNYAGRGKVYSKVVGTNEVAWIDGLEGQYSGKVEISEWKKKVDNESYNDYINRLSDTFDKALQQQIDGTLPSDYVYDAGMPNDILLSTGFPNSPIELLARRLAYKSQLLRHPFALEDIKGLVKALQRPIAIFEYGNKGKNRNVIVDIQKRDKHFLVGVGFIADRNKSDINDIRTIFPKDNAEWLNWIAQDKSLYLDKVKIQDLISQQRMNFAEVKYLDLDYITKIIENFENPKLPSQIRLQKPLGSSATEIIDNASERVESEIDIAKQSLQLLSCYNKDDIIVDCYRWYVKEDKISPFLFDSDGNTNIPYNPYK